MKLMKYLSILTLIVVASVSQAQVKATDKCSTCAPLEQVIQKFKSNSRDALSEAREQLQMFEFSPDANIRAREVATYVRMAAWAILKDHEGDSDSYFYNAREEYPKDFDKAISALPQKDQLLLQKSLKNAEQVMKKGNG